MSATTPAPFVMLGAADAAACEGDACVVPGATGGSPAAEAPDTRG